MIYGNTRFFEQCIVKYYGSKFVVRSKKIIQVISEWIYLKLNYADWLIYLLLLVFIELVSIETRRETYGFVARHILIHATSTLMNHDRVHATWNS